MQRVADRLIREVDRLAASQWGGIDWDLRLLVPRYVQDRAEMKAIKVIGQRWGHTQIWEQMLLPVVARNGILLNLANFAPVAHGAKITMMHDAQSYLVSESYPLHFTVGYRLLVPFMAATSRVVLTVSEFSREMLAGFGVSDRKRTDVLYNGVDHILQHPADMRVLAQHGLDTDFALMVGSLRSYKNASTVFEAMKRPMARPLKLVVVGPEKSEFLSAGYSPPPGTVFVGKVEDGALRALYENAVCLLHPSRTEGFGLVPLEAMLCGCPAIAAPAGAVPEICRDAVLYADVDDPKGWAERVASIMADTDLRSSKIVQGRNRAQQFTWAHSGEKLMSILKDMAL